jgi:CRP-like cAMP-binding protein
MVDKETLQKVNIFGELKEFAWQELLKIIAVKEFYEGKIIFSEGDESTELYMVLKGEIEIQIHIAPQLSSSTVYVVKPYDIFGEFAFVDPKPRAATARSATDSTVGVIKKDDFEELIKKFPGVGINFYRALVNMLSERLRKMNNYLKGTLIRCIGLEI